MFFFLIGVVIVLLLLLNRKKVVLQPQINDAQEALNHTTAKEKKQKQKEFKLLKKKLYASAGITKWSEIITGTTTAATFLIQYATISKLCDTPGINFSEGGPFWIFDLTSPDPYYILPTIFYILTMIRTYHRDSTLVLSSFEKSTRAVSSFSLGIVAIFLSGRASVS